MDLESAPIEEHATFVCGMLEKPATPGNAAEPDTTLDTDRM